MANKKRLREAIAINDEWELESLLALPEARLIADHVHEGQTPLMRAAAKRRHKIVAMLLDVRECAGGG